MSSITTQLENTPSFYKEESLEKPSKKRKLNSDPSITWESDDFIIDKILGKGCFSTVFQSLHTPSGKLFAIKEIDTSKWENIDKVTTAALLSFKLQHPFLIKHYSFLEFQNQEVKQKKHLLIEQLSGVEAFKYLFNHKPFTLHETRFFIASILSVIKYLHDQSIVHRDLKLENIFLMENGYPKLFDLDFMKSLVNSNGRTSTHCGSPDYAAPELLSSIKDYKGTSVDMWAIGIITYICLTKNMPFYTSSLNQQHLFINIIYKEPFYNLPVFKEKEGTIAKNFIQSLIKKKPDERINVDEALAHPFLKEFNSDDIESQRKPSPFLIAP